MKKTNWLFIIVTAVIMVVILFPFVWVFFASIKPEAEIFGRLAYNPFTGHPTLAHYINVIWNKGMPNAIKNSFIVSSVTMVYIIIISSLSAYIISRFIFPGKSLLMGVILAVSMFPQMIVVGPVYNLFMNLGITNSYWVVLPYCTITLPVAVWILVTHFNTIPMSLEESAKIDGCSSIQTLVRIVFPLAAPGVFTTGIIVFIAAWNEFLLTITMNTNVNYHTVPVAISFLRTQFQILWGDTTAATILVTIPTLVIVLVFQKQIVSGIVSGAVKE